MDVHGRSHEFHVTMFKPYPHENLLNDFLPVRRNGRTPEDIYLIVETIHNEDDPRFDQAKHDEISGIIKKGGFKIVEKESVPPDSFFIPNSFVMTIKEPGYPEERFKARLVMQGHRDPHRHQIVNAAPVLLRFSVCIVSTSILVFKGKMRKRDTVQGHIKHTRTQSYIYCAS